MPEVLRILGQNGVLAGTQAERDLVRLRKDFPGIDQDLCREVLALGLRSCLPPDTPIPGTNGKAFKRRVRSSDRPEGKRGGFRFVYGIFPQGIVFLKLYHKSVQQDVSIGVLLKELESAGQALAMASPAPES